MRPTNETRRAKILVILPTSTWTSYNDFGGANHYFGVAGPERNLASPVLSLERPWTRGIVWLPPGAPRICADPVPEFGDAPRYPQTEWAYANGFGQYYASAGWAQFDRHFVVWAEEAGYELDFITQTDLHYRPATLDAYPCLTIIGHDEYWTREMRLAIEAYVERGGRLARFGANFLWQIRLEDEGRRQVCYKFDAINTDPIAGTGRDHLLTTAWEDRHVRWPGASTVGVNGVNGLYASWGGFAPHGQKGFTVYRPEHWAFAGTGLHYADIFGDSARIFAYEVDGLDYTFRHGLPYPVPVEGQPETIQILAMAPAVLAEDEPDGEGFRYFVRSSDLEGLVKCVTGEVTPETLARYKYGSGMMVHMTRGKGEVLTAATCEWVMGSEARRSFHADDHAQRTGSIHRRVIVAQCRARPRPHARRPQAWICQLRRTSPPGGRLSRRRLQLWYRRWPPNRPLRESARRARPNAARSANDQRGLAGKASAHAIRQMLLSSERSAAL